MQKKIVNDTKWMFSFICHREEFCDWQLVRIVSSAASLYAFFTRTKEEEMEKSKGGQ